MIVSACGSKTPQAVVLPELVSMDVNIYMLTTKNDDGFGDSVGVIIITECLPVGVHDFHLH